MSDISGSSTKNSPQHGSKIKTLAKAEGSHSKKLANEIPTNN